MVYGLSTDTGPSEPVHYGAEYNLMQTVTFWF